MIKKIICFIATLIICLALFCGCNKETDAKASDDKAAIGTTSLESYVEDKSDILTAGEVNGVDTVGNEANMAYGELVPKEENMEGILKHFDLTDPKILFDETSFSDSMYAEVERIIVVFKKTTTFPRLDIHHFGLSNAKSFAYLQMTPNDGPRGWVDYDDGHQQGEIHLYNLGKEKILEAIRHLEQLEFVKSVWPDYYVVMHC
ncbi:MAG: hypothetical protein PHC84_01745 [Clostridia bacterium]|nr:hypothetical protein [Clostridia bacterium]